MIASCDLGWCYTESAEMTGDENYVNTEFNNLGEERVDSEQRYQTMLENGITIAFVTDYPATCNVNPFLCMEIGSNRAYEGMESGSPYHPSTHFRIIVIIDFISHHSSGIPGRAQCCYIHG